MEKDKQTETDMVHHDRKLSEALAKVTYDFSATL